MVSLINEIIKLKYPCFANGNCDVNDSQHKYVTFYYDSNVPIAIYDSYVKQLEITKDLFQTLISFLGEERLEYMLQWFNEKYNKNAEILLYME